MANQEKPLQSLTVNYLSLKQFRALQSTQSLKSDEVYTIKDLDMYTKVANSKIIKAKPFEHKGLTFIVVRSLNSFPFHIY